MTKPFMVLIDMDNVIADQTQGFYDILKAEYPKIALPERETLKEFDIEKNFPNEHQELIKSLRLRKGFFGNLPLMTGAKDGLARLKDLADHVRIVTAPTWEWKHCVLEKYEWVEAHLGRRWTEKIVLARDKTSVKGHLLIDDSPAVSGFWTPMWTHVLYDQPYNRSVDMPRLSWDTMDTFINNWKANLPAESL